MRLPICRRYRPAATLYVLALALALLVGNGASCAREPNARRADQVRFDELPIEAHKTLSLIKKDGPFPYHRDGATFGNFERRLPQKERGYYKEYTVPTPGVRDRGARRIVAGRKGEFYFTDDHYQTFRWILE